jgi:hypothetical protein
MNMVHEERHDGRDINPFDGMKPPELCDTQPVFIVDRIAFDLAADSTACNVCQAGMADEVSWDLAIRWPARHCPASPFLRLFDGWHTCSTPARIKERRKAKGRDLSRHLLLIFMFCVGDLFSL